MLSRLGTNHWTATDWTLLRRVLGAYITIHFAMLLPYAGEVFSQSGLLPQEHSPLMGFLPNLLSMNGSAGMATAVVALGAAAGLFLFFGRQPRIAAVVAWYVGACLLARNPLILNPAMPHVGWTLLWFAAVPSPRRGRAWELPKEMFAAAWMLMGLSLTWSAATKLGSVSWLDGSALYYVWENPLARDTALRSALVALPPSVHAALTWGTLILELLVLPAAFYPRARAAIWWGLLVMHLGLLATVNFTDLTTGMLVVHLTVFDRSYWPWKHTVKRAPPPGASSTAMLPPSRATS